jgi:hypothetical protein
MGECTVHTNQYISHPVNLERWLMEGSYSKVWGARSQMPMEEYRYFVDLLVDTIRWGFLFEFSTRNLYSDCVNFVCLRSHRNEIASCQEKAYSSLPLNDAGTLLFFKTPGEVIEFAQQVKLVPHELHLVILFFPFVKRNLMIKPSTYLFSESGSSTQTRKPLISQSKTMLPSMN